MRQDKWRHRQSKERTKSIHSRQTAPNKRPALAISNSTIQLSSWCICYQKDAGEERASEREKASGANSQVSPSQLESTYSSKRTQYAYTLMVLHTFVESNGRNGLKNTLQHLAQRERRRREEERKRKREKQTH